MLTRGGEPLHLGPLHFPDQFVLGDEPLAGGEGRVWKATFDDGLRTPITRALKVMRPADSGRIDVREQRELHAMARLLQESSVPHLVRVWGTFEAAPEHEAGTADQLTERVLVLEMEWDGLSPSRGCA